MGVSATGEVPVPDFNGRPFIELGPSFRTAHNKSGTEPSNYGITGGAGVEMH